MLRLLVAGLVALFQWAPALASTAVSDEVQRTRVMVVSSLHQLHDGHPGYDYETLYSRVRDFRPDWVGVEMRPEDMDLSPEAQAQVYPPEMIALRAEWGDRAFGFDWLGRQLEGAPLAMPWAREVIAFKQAEQRLAAAPLMNDPRLAEIAARQQALLAGATPAGMNDGRYDQLQLDFDERLAALTTGTEHQLVTDFRRARDDRIDAAIIEWLRMHPGSRIVVVMGAAHRAYAVRAIQRELGDAVEIVPVP